MQNYWPLVISLYNLDKQFEHLNLNLLQVHILLIVRNGVSLQELPWGPNYRLSPVYTTKLCKAGN